MTLLSNLFKNQEAIDNRENVNLGAAIGDAKRVILFDANGNAIGVSDTSTVTSVGDSAGSVTLKAANTARKGLIIFNNSSAILFVKFGATATTADFTLRLTPFATYEMVGVIYNGVVDGIWASDAGGTALVTELT